VSRYNSYIYYFCTIEHDVNKEKKRKEKKRRRKRRSCPCSQLAEHYAMKTYGEVNV
jgi:hypothetical protein